MTVSYVDTFILADVCESMRKYTRKRMHFIKYLVMCKTDIYTNKCQIALVIVTNSNETLLKNEWVRDGFTQARFTREPGQLMMCEGELSKITIIDTPLVGIPVAFFSKQRCNRIIVCNLPANQLLHFLIHSQCGTLLGEGEICA